MDQMVIDRSPTLARAAMDAQVGFPLALADAATLPLTDRVVALVVASMSLMDVDDLAGTMQEIGRVLQPGGVLCAAIVHPFSSAVDISSMATESFTVSEPYLEARRYEVAVERDGIAMTFVSMHWPLSAYVTATSRAGMAITELRELGDGRVPWLLALRAEKRA